nr:SUMF1/EgtB/PvdO family nonheme iron enzyme [Allochromatium humboldtianum]
MRPLFGRLGLWLCLCLSAVAVLAEPPPRTPDNPKPAEGDVVIDLPNESQLVFRRLTVPGPGFWGDQQRVIQIGDATGGIFEGLQRTQISGSFPNADGTGWEILLAKYELTRGQYIAVMGLERLLAVSADPEDQKIPTLDGRAKREALMRPLASVSHQDIQDFIRTLNQWLFDPAHPERTTKLPTYADVPGFIRLPTEEELEYATRGGQPALEAGVFDDRLPFDAARLDEYAWHLGNAKHQLRPIGLRQPNGLGLYDLIGNAQEMTTGVFRPEIWQGKPGGVAVRGGSVSTPPADLRSSLRAELDVYAWKPDEGRIEERRSYNTGARLAIGSNVVLTTAQRKALEDEYLAYRNETRRAMPVGRTLDNLVAQASVQLGTVDPIIERLMADNPALREPLQTVQVYMDRARDRLELAQRESARSLAQDAARNGVNLSVYLSRLERLAATLESAQKLAELSTRYQDQVEAVERSIREIETAAREQLQGYRDKIAKLGEYEPDYIAQAFKTLGEGELPVRERAVMELLAVHVEEFAEQRRAEPERWLEEFRARFKDFKDN